MMKLLLTSSDIRNASGFVKRGQNVSPSIFESGAGENAISSPATVVFPARIGPESITTDIPIFFGPDPTASARSADELSFGARLGEFRRRILLTSLQVRDSMGACKPSLAVGANHEASGISSVKCFHYYKPAHTRRQMRVSQPA